MSELREQFLLDGVSFTENLASLVASWGTRRPEEGQLDRAFRLAHSLKSEADYLEVDAVGAAAHELESILQGVRDGKRSWSAAIPDEISAKIEILSSYFALHEETPAVPSVQPTEAKPLAQLVLSDLEKTLLREAYSRGERAYRLLVAIAADSAMKFPRAYLVANNLELSVNVIRVEPPMDGDESRDYTNIDFCFTTSKDPEEVRGLIEVDEVESVRILDLDFRDHVSMSSARRLALRDVEIPGFRLRAEQVDTLRSSVASLVRSLSGMSDAPTELATAVETLNELVSDLLTVRTGDLAASYSQYARETARKVGKDVDVQVDVDPSALPRATVSILNKVVGQLVSNALVHGIEEREERADLGKPARGSLEVHIAREGHTVTGYVRDDGRGIPGESVRRRAKELGISPIQKLIDILATPGFTTKEEADQSAGRGVGLDVVKRTLDDAGGEFDLFQSLGEGCRFTFQLPVK
jgi:two-component system chemotaxis sensor kinase CheA